MSTTDPLEALARALQTGDDVAAEQAALALDPTAEGALIAWLGEADPERRWWAARSLAHCGEAAAASALLQLVDDPDPALRAVAAFALGHLHARCPEAVQPLLAALATHLADEAGAVRQAVADALALCGDAAVPALAAVLAGDHEGARSRAAYALRKIATLPAAIVLYRCLNDPNYLVHTYAYEGLEEMGLLETTLVAPA
jgi:HEAT repeat protein